MRTLTTTVVAAAAMMTACGSLGQNTKNHDTSRHKVVYQEGVDVRVTRGGKTETKRIVVYGVAGLSFPASPLKVDTSVTLSRTVIKIIGADGGTLQAASESAVPIVYGTDEDREESITFLANCINATWEFARPGMKFRIDGEDYETLKAGATIMFLANGLRLDGFKRSGKELKTPLSEFPVVDIDRRPYGATNVAAAVPSAEGVSVALYRGMPFPARVLKVEGELKSPLSISVVGFRQGNFIPSDDSEIPLRLSGKGSNTLGMLWTQAANVTWRFKSKGLRFETPDGSYITQKDDARIVFTKAGVQLDGVTKLTSGDEKGEK